MFHFVVGLECAWFYGILREFAKIAVGAKNGGLVDSRTALFKLGYYLKTRSCAMLLNYVTYYTHYEHFHGNR